MFVRFVLLADLYTFNHMIVYLLNALDQSEFYSKAFL